MKRKERTGVKNEIIKALEQNRNSYVSGGYIARKCNVSRQAVFKAVKSLCDEGYKITGESGKGYKLDATCDILSADVITEFTDLPAFCYECVGSTNFVAMGKYYDNRDCIVTADTQTAGERKDGGDFYSPEYGVYVSYAITKQGYIKDIDEVRKAAAQAVLTCVKPFAPEAGLREIDEIYSNGKKIGGILIQTFCTAASGLYRFVVIGVGLYCNREDMPSGVKSVNLKETRNKLVIDIFRELKKRI